MASKATVFRGLVGLFFLAAAVLGTVAPDAGTAPEAKAKVAAKKRKLALKDAGVVVPRPPQLVHVFPAGGQRGTTLEAAVHGLDLKEIKAIRFSGAGLTARLLPVGPPQEAPAPATKTAGKGAKKAKGKQKNPLEIDTEAVRVAITIAPDAELGECDLRVITPNGVSNRVRFLVDQLPEVIEVEPNNRLREAQPLPSLPVVVNGQLLAGDVDVFRFAARAGQTIVCELQGRRLLPFVAEAVPGWLQGILTLYDADGREVAYADAIRCNLDPVLIHRVVKDGEYCLEVRDALYRGTPKFVYRLRIGALPYLTDVFPLGGRRGTQVPVLLSGVNLDRDRLVVHVPAEGHATRVGVTCGGLASNTVPFGIGDLEEVFETEGNDARAEANPIRPGTVVNGRIDRPGDIDTFVFTAKAGQTLVFEVVARRLGSPLDSFLAVHDASGKQLAANDDTVDDWEQALTHHADSRLVFTCPSPGKYYLRLSDAQGNGGKEYAYRLCVAPPRPDFLLRFLPDNPSVGGGDAAVLRVQAVRRDGFKGRINLALQLVSEGLRTSRAAILAGQNEALLAISASPQAVPALLPLAITGTAEVGGETVTRQAVPAEEAEQAFIYKHYLPTREAVLAVTGPAALFTLSPRLGPGQVVEIPRGEGKVNKTPTGQFTLAINRKEGGTGFIRFANAFATKKVRSARPMSPSVVLVTGTATRDETEVTIKVTPLARAIVGQVYEVVVSGTMKVGKEEVVRSTVVPIRIVAKAK